MLHKERVKVFIAEEPFRLRRATLDSPSASRSHLALSFQESALISLPLQQPVDSVAFLTARVLGTAQALRCAGPSRPAQVSTTPRLQLGRK